MGQCELKDFFDGTWGIVAHRRDEIERGGSGTFDRVLREEMDKNFVDYQGAAEIPEVSPGYASSLLMNKGVRYIMHNSARAFLIEDVNALYRKRLFDKQEARRIAELKKVSAKAAKNAK